MPASSAPAAKPDELAIAAFEAFSTRGIAAVSMDDIAAGAGVTKGSLYWHYSSKKEVILAACRHYYSVWRMQMTEATDATPTNLAKLEAAVEYSVRGCLFDETNRIFTTEIVALALYDPEVRASWAGFLDETDRLFLGLVHRAVGAGELVCDDVDRAVSVMLAAMEGVKQLALFRPLSAAPDSVARVSDDLMSLLGRTTSVAAISV